MNVPREEIARKVREWLLLALDDLNLARHGLTMPANPPYHLVAYHAQQCAEKTLKAYLVHRLVEIPYTHDIEHLLELCGECVPWVRDIDDAKELTAFSVVTRYPGRGTAVTEAEAVRAIELAAHVRDVVSAGLKAEGLAPAE